MRKRQYSRTLVAPFALVTSLLVAGTGITIAAAASPAHRLMATTSYTFQSIANTADPTFNQLLGINDQGTIAGYFGSGMPATSHPNKGYTVVPPYAQGNFTNENFPGSDQTQVIAINNAGDTGGFYVTGGATPVTHGFLDTGGTFTTVDAAVAPLNQILGLNNNHQAAGSYSGCGGDLPRVHLHLYRRQPRRRHVCVPFPDSRQ